MWITVTDNHNDDYMINTDLIYMIHTPSHSIFFAGENGPMHLAESSMEKIKNIIKENIHRHRYEGVMDEVTE